MGGAKPKTIVEIAGEDGRYRRLDDGRYHYVTFIRRRNNVTVQVDDLPVGRPRIHGQCTD